MLDFLKDEDSDSDEVILQPTIPDPIFIEIPLNPWQEEFNKALSNPQQMKAWQTQYGSTLKPEHKIWTLLQAAKNNHFESIKWVLSDNAIEDALINQAFQICADKSDFLIIKWFIENHLSKLDLIEAYVCAQINNRVGLKKYFYKHREKEHDIVMSLPGVLLPLETLQNNFWVMVTQETEIENTSTYLPYFCTFEPPGEIKMDEDSNPYDKNNVQKIKVI